MRCVHGKEVATSGRKGRDGQGFNVLMITGYIVDESESIM